MIKCNHDQIAQHFKILKYRRKWSCYEWQREFSGKLLSKHCVEYLQPKYKVYIMSDKTEEWGKYTTRSCSRKSMVDINFFWYTTPGWKYNTDIPLFAVWYTLDIPSRAGALEGISRVYQTAHSGISGCCSSTTILVFCCKF